jgi:acyl-coenzyme A thioesterase PaaI-like protein
MASAAVRLFPLKSLQGPVRGQRFAARRVRRVCEREDGVGFGFAVARDRQPSEREAPRRSQLTHLASGGQAARSNVQLVEKDGAFARRTFSCEARPSRGRLAAEVAKAGGFCQNLGVSLAQTLASLSPQKALQREGNIVRDLWDVAQKVPFGTRLFSRALGMAAPYTGTIPFEVRKLEKGSSECVLFDKPGARNHLKCIHAVALVNFAEVTGNIALAYGLPDDARFIVAGLSIEYLKKARGTIRGTCEMPVIATSEKREYDVPVVMRNEGGEVVATATLRTLVGPKAR